MNSIKWLHGNLKPPKLFSWQTVILLALILWFILILVILSVPGFNYDRNFLNVLAQLFFVVGVGWWQIETPWKLGGFPLGTWVVSALVCMFLFKNSANLLPDIAFLFWPLLAAFLSTLPFFFDRGFKFQIPDLSHRVRLTLLWLLCLLVSCWLQFHFYLEAWLMRYPNLLVEDVSDSDFVVRVGIPSSQYSLGGPTIVDVLQSWLTGQIENQSWSKVEEVLMKINHQETDLQAEATDRVRGFLLTRLWQPEIEILESGILGNSDLYNLKLRARWQGPASEKGINSWVRTCKVRRTPTDPQVPGIGIIDCQLTIDREDPYEQ